MNEEIKKLDFTFAYELKEAMKIADRNRQIGVTCQVVEEALIKFGLKNTARAFKRIILN